jgi:hypothetical protein
VGPKFHPTKGEQLDLAVGGSTKFSLFKVAAKAKPLQASQHNNAISLLDASIQWMISPSHAI